MINNGFQSHFYKNFLVIQQHIIKTGPVYRVLILPNLSFQLFHAVRVVNNFELIKFFRCVKKGYKPNNIPLKSLFDKNLEVSKVNKLKSRK